MHDIDRLGIIYYYEDKCINAGLADFANTLDIVKEALIMRHCPCV